MNKKTARLKSWDEVDRALRQIHECGITAGILTGEAETKINDIREYYKNLKKAYDTETEILQAQIKDFVSNNTEDLSGKSKQLTFGTVGFRQSTRISYDNKKAELIKTKLKELNMIDCIKTVETIDKPSLSHYPDEALSELGVKRIIEDNFYYEINKESIKSS